MSLSREAVLLSCESSIVTLLRQKAGIDLSPNASTEDEVKALVEWCVEHTISSDEVSALAAAASREAGVRVTIEWCESGDGSRFDLSDPDELDEYDADHVSTYAELGPGCAAALAMLGHALGTNMDNIDVVEKAHIFVQKVATELLALRKAKQDAPLSKITTPAPSPLNFADYANRVRCGAPLPPVPDEERQALRYFLDLEAERDERLMEKGAATGYPCGNLRSYTTGNIKRLRACIESLMVSK